jgi:hypothetical protein
MCIVNLFPDEPSFVTKHYKLQYITSNEKEVPPILCSACYAILHGQSRYHCEAV